ncbi:non-ribosomal peptide synthetase [Streptomyces sp. JJ36]|uniref:non-ribosomal peptide synthetase n=1 Tax=Streptomyces sp. JJ36 TaxID=2736645 RepID=UPI001F44000E|nr:non-ribosomal peptide synthetase [Streptomyces sp. JJ36]MCF6522532.1 amino acid adenylation domain-containing protein [Streptomyces sp. JJ36]
MTTEQTHPAAASTAPDEEAPAVLPMSSGQQRLWFLAQLDSGSAAAYLGHGAARLRGRLDEEALQRAADALVRRHETLRTSFGLDGTEPVQYVHPTGRLPVTRRDLPAADDPDAALQEILTEETSTPFRTDAAPLARMTLVRLGPEDHLLVVTFHHGIGDMWSGAVFVRELAACYEAELTGAPPDLPALPVQYGDYAAWQQRRLEDGEFLGDLAWWRMTLDDLPVLELATDLPRPPVQSFRGAVRGTRLPAELVGDLERLARERGASLFMVLHAAYCVLLSRYSGQQDIPVGTSVAGRDRPELENLIGMFINTLVLRTDLSGDPTFEQVLDRSRETCLGAYAHAGLPFERLVEEVKPERDLSRSPLAQVWLMLGNTPPGDLRMGGLDVEPVEADTGTAKVDLFLSLVPDGAGGLRVTLEYDTALFTADTADRMLDHLTLLLREAAADPSRPLSRFPALPEAEAELLAAWGSGDTAAPRRTLPVHRMFEEQAARTGDKTAVFLDDHTLTYRELNTRANRLAHLLRRRGVRPGTRVGVCTERTPDLLVALLAVLKSGGAYVPVDPGYPAERVRFMLRDADAAVLLTHRSVAAALPGHDAETVCLDADPAADEPGHDPEPVGGPGDLAYVIYTSGSTGRPKGVMIPHGRLPNFLDCMRREPGLGEDDVVAATITHAFDMSVLDFFLPLTTGATIALVPRDEAVDGERLAARMTATGATYWQATPAAWQLLLDAGWRAAHPFRGLCGAEPLDPGLARRMAAAGVEVWQVYGPTETTVWAGCHRFREGDAPVPLGRPLAHTRFRVLDRAGRPVPVGVTGELHISGPGVALGYHGRPDLTDRHFLPDPEAPDARMYRTGDLVRYRGDGRLEFVGRADSQVKIRGFRVELGEITAVLREHPEVRAAVVVVREDTPGDRRLVGYAEPAAMPADPGTLAAALRDFARLRVPEYMVPAVVVVLPALPRTPNGKVDRRALPDPEGPARASDDASTAPRTDTERYVAALWAEVLKTDVVSAGDDFFDLGGHSLLAGRVVSRLSRRYGRRIPVRTLFDNPTVTALAARLDAETETEAEADAGTAAGPSPAVPPPGAPEAPAPAARPAPPGPAAGDGPVPLPRAAESGGPAPGHVLLPASPGQARLWFLHRLDPGSATAYLMSGQVEIHGHVDEDALQRAVDVLVDRHESLRTALVDVDGEPRQAIAPHATVSLDRGDLRTLPQSAREEEAGRLLREAATRPFDLTRAPLLRLTLLRTGADRRVLSLVLHHAICDRWSVAVLVRELVTVYEALTEGREPDLPPLPVQYADHAAWQRARLDSPETEAQLAHWREKLRDLPVVDLPTDHPRPPVQTFHGAVRTRTLPGEVLRTLEHIGRREGATLFMVLLAAYYVLLQRYSGRHDLAVGSPVAGRGRPETEGLIGFFVGNLVLRTDLSSDPAFTGLVARVRDTCLDAYAHADVPFERLVEETGAARDLSRTPLFQTVFSFGNVEVPQTRMGDARVRPFDVDTGTSKFDLVLEIVPRDGGWRAALEYNTDLFEQHTADRLLDHFVALLEAAAADPARPLSALPALTERDARAVEAWSRGESRSVPGTTAHALFEQQARQRPDAVALRCPDGTTVSYAELDSRADRLARHLRTLGVGPGTLVALCTPRSPDTYTGILGVLKAGGAYVPVDPGYPAERIRHMLADCAASVLLTHSSLRDRLPAHGAATVLLDRPGPGTGGPDGGPAPGERSGSDRVPATAGPDDLAYVIYTSGSTGRPKGTMVTHRSVADLHLTRHLTHIGPGDTLLAFASSSFDASVWEWVTALLGGATLAVPAPGATLAGEELAATVREHGVTAALLPPSLLAVLDPDDLPTLRTVVSGGEDCPAAVAARWAGHVRLINAYGPTETTVYATLSGTLAGDRHPPIGRPVPNATVQVLDAAGRPVPVGVPGELYVGGPGVAAGYLGRPDLTAERFTPDPDRPGGRRYRTGDLVRWLPDGQLEYLGRRDDQVKVRGFRVEPGEIEAVLRTHPGVRDAVVLLREDTPGDPRLTGYVRTEDGRADAGTDALTGELRTLLRDRLPGYMVPAHLVALAGFPRTPSGKTDRAALPRPDAVPLPAGASRTPPATPAEEQVTALFAEVLGTEDVGVHDDFFERGGNSLTATRLHALVRDTWPEARVPLRLLFEHPTPHALAAAVTRRDAGTSDDADTRPLADVFLAPGTRPERPWQWRGDPQTVLLTGATGFLGAFLLDALLRTTGADIVCLVRGDTAGQAGARLTGHLRDLRLWERWDEATRERVRALPGDLAEPHLGLGPDGFRRLAREVEEIHHCGAAVNFAEPYTALRDANVGGTRTILQLACTGPVKPVHHISTLSVFTLRREGDPPAREDELPSVPPPAENGYNQSKWVAEQLVGIARRRGLPVSVYRPGRIAGDSGSGVWRPDDVFTHILRACAVVGSVPTLDFRTDIVPVDHIARVVSLVARGEEHLGGTYQFGGARRLTFDTVHEALRRAGHPVRRDSFEDWYEACRTHARRHPGSDLGPTLSLFGKRVDDDRQGLREPVFDTSNTRRATGGLRPPAVDAALLTRYVRELTATGFLPPPPGAPTDV